ncbi:hypothetical protein [Mesorhizobium sp.]|uniref:hypothetical protein n=1 Tax=Mesorhizobium sp. TaxID=1871066 RepID=UPI000FE72F0F|nr:hypothetical protein [Mesorhizobium sp.]RWC38340.1 MAG: hypothetical protein EOS28_30320 [Mesorhizobium sp.]RWE90287.1 MAG: hypothetical protein EOS68_31015 [Mesorhizobium sp.]
MAGTTVAVLSALAIVSIKVGEFMKSLRLLEALSLPVLVPLPFILSIAVDRWMHGALDTALILAVLAEIAFVLFYWGKLRR